MKIRTGQLPIRKRVSYPPCQDDRHSMEVITGLYRYHTTTETRNIGRFLSGVWTVNSPQSHIVRVYDAGRGKSGVFHSAEWHDGDWSSDGIREAWLWFFIWVESLSFLAWLRAKRLLSDWMLGTVNIDSDWLPRGLNLMSCSSRGALSMNLAAEWRRQIVRVHYFVRGGFVGYRSRASSKHLSPHLPVGSLDSSGGSNRVCAASEVARVGVESTKKPTPDVVVVFET
ncbi:hypothetical protein TNCV_789081 [Trichonephila clavipes]|nr:hypothetical protein TNCV_789081 [Trichonephila clavipes]